MAFNIIQAEQLKFRDARYPTVRLFLCGSSLATVHLRIVTKDGVAKHSQALVTAYSWQYKDFRISDLPIMAHLYCYTSDIQPGELYARALLMFAGEYVLTLFQGYVSTYRDLWWPPGSNQQPGDGPGRLRSITGTDPAAGAEISETVPDNARWKLRSIIFTLVTDATVVNRAPQLVIDDGANILWKVPPGLYQTASGTIVWIFAQGQGYRTITINVDAIMNVLPDLMLFRGWRIRTSTVGLQAGDNYGAPQLLVEEWIKE